MGKKKIKDDVDKDEIRKMLDCLKKKGKGCV